MKGFNASSVKETLIDSARKTHHKVKQLKDGRRGERRQGDVKGFLATLK